MLESALIAGLMGSGADCYLLGVTTTPSVSYVVQDGGFDGAIMITASHNPFYDNGIKLINSDGYKMRGSVLEAIEDYLDEGRGLPLATGVDIGRIVEFEVGRRRYTDRLLETADFRLDGYEIAVDCANGAATPIAAGVLESLGARVHAIGTSPDGVNINVDCGSTHISNLRRFVLEKGVDVGFAFDGDADRCIAVDGKGRVIDGDLILYVCADYLAQLGVLAKNTVVTTVMANIGLYKALEKRGIGHETTAVGDQNVYAAMQQGQYNLGGEQSGHVIFGDLETTGDGIMTSLRILETMVAQQATLSDLAAPVSIYPQTIANVPVANKAIVMDSDRLREAVKVAEQALGDDGRVLVRASGTEPLVRVMVEAPTTDICTERASALVRAIKQVDFGPSNQPAGDVGALVP